MTADENAWADVYEQATGHRPNRIIRAGETEPQPWPDQPPKVRRNDPTERAKIAKAKKQVKKRQKQRRKKPR